MKTVYIGSGAGFAGDRLDAGLPVVRTLAKRDGPKYLIFEVMGERTLAIAQRIKMRNPDMGYSPYLEPYLRGVLKTAKESGVRIVANLGNANPLGGAKKTLELARELGVEGLRVAVVLGDDLLSFMSSDEVEALPAVEICLSSWSSTSSGLVISPVQCTSRSSVRHMCTRDGLPSHETTPRVTKSCKCASIDMAAAGCRRASTAA